MKDDISETRAMIARMTAPPAGGDGGRQDPPIDGATAPTDDPKMEKRLTVLETRWDAVIPTLATKADLSEMTTRIILAMVTGLGVTIGILAFVTSRSAAPAQQPPIIITVPAVAAAAAPAPPPAVATLASAPAKAPASGP